MSWDALRAWGENATRVGPFSGGVANDVWELRLGDKRAVGRLGRRSDDDLAWEIALIQHLDRQGFTVPLPIPTQDGRLFVDGLVVMEYLEGEAPADEADWRRVADTLRQVHAVTLDWPQRPGWKSSIDLITEDAGTRVDLRRMPVKGVARCRAAWAKMVGKETCVVHGDPNPRNLRLTAERVGLIDWDEARVDVPDLDLVLPHNAAELAEADYDIAQQATAAWEAAVCWGDDYAIRRLDEVRVP